MITIRIAKADDFRAIAALHTESWKLHYRGIESDDYLDNHIDAERLETWTKQFENPHKNQHIIIAEENGQFCGFACLYGDFDPKLGTMVDNLHVSSKKQGQGIGRLLLRSAAYWANQNFPQKPLYLYVYKKNTAATKFYQHLGGYCFEVAPLKNHSGGSIETLCCVWEDLTVLF